MICGCLECHIYKHRQSPVPSVPKAQASTLWVNEEYSYALRDLGFVIRITIIYRCEALALYVEQGSVKLKMEYTNSNIRWSHFHFCPFEMLGLKSNSNRLIVVESQLTKRTTQTGWNARNQRDLKGFSTSITISCQHDLQQKRHPVTLAQLSSTCGLKVPQISSTHSFYRCSESDALKYTCCLLSLGTFN